MDKKQIEEILDQLVIWEPRDRVDDRINLKDQSETKKRLLDMGYDEEEIDNVLDEMAHDSRMVIDGINVTVPKKIKALKLQSKPCEFNCGQMVIGQKIEKSFHNYPEDHWRTKCLSCQHYQHPLGYMVKGVNEIVSYFNKKIKQKNK